MASGLECTRVLVRGGRFAMGAEGTAYAPVQPDVTVGDFALDATEVTVQRFRRFMDALAAGPEPSRFAATYPSGAELAVDRTGFPSSVDLGGLHCNWTPMVRSPARESHPMNCVPWAMAFAFCAWDGGRLPTEAEQEYVDRWWRSPAGRAYPWGADEPACVRVQWRANAGVERPCPGDDTRDTRRVGSLAAGAWAGVYDLAGNVAEWSADTFAAYAPTSSPNGCWGVGPQRDPLCHTMGGTEYASRGGSWVDDDPSGDPLRGYARVRVGRQASGTPRGLRCARASGALAQ